MIHISARVRTAAWTIVVAALLAPAALAHTGTGASNEHGELDALLQENEEGDCEIVLTGRHVQEEEGVLAFRKAPTGPGGPSTLLEVPVDGDAEADGDGFRFEEGPFTFPTTDAPSWVDLVLDIGGEDHTVTVFFDFGSCRVDPSVHVADEADGRGTLDIECGFFVVGRHIRADSGTLQVLVEGTLDPALTELYEAEPEDDGVGFILVSGQLNVAPGTYRIRLVEEGDDRVVVSDPFLVTCSEAPPDCPDGVAAEALPDGGVRLTWSAVTGANGYRIHRGAGDDALTLLDETTDTTFIDDTTVADVTYTYRVTALTDAGGSEGCDELSVTAVPYFGTALYVALAVGGSLGAIAWVWARRK